jgi:excinuclease ABC subunit B
MGQTAVADAKAAEPKAYIEKTGIDIAADPLVRYMSREQIEKAVAKLEQQMKAAVKELDFIEAARFRDEIYALKEKLK